MPTLLALFAFVVITTLAAVPNAAHALPDEMWDGSIYADGDEECPHSVWTGSGTKYDMCTSPEAACISHFDQGVYQPSLAPKEITAVPDSEGRLDHYDCWIDPPGEILGPRTHDSERWCEINGEWSKSSIPCADARAKANGEAELACVGNPINAATGNKYAEVVDFATEGPDVLEFRRYYNSNDHLTGAFFSRKWRTTYDRTVFVSSGGNDAFLRRENGQVFHFEKSGTDWVKASGNGDVQFELEELTSTYEVTTPDQTVEEYDSDGKLTKVTFPNGYEQTLTYNASDELTDVDDSHGREITFTYWSDGLLSTVTDPDGEVYTYRYHGAYNRLAQVIYPDGTASNETHNTRVDYHYEDTDYPHHLTGITDEEGVRYATWDYDDKGRAISSEHAGGANETTLTYNTDGTVTVENALTKQAKYHFTTTQGVPKVEKIEGLASTNCVAADSLYEYDTNGYIDKITDREGNIKTLVNNSRGLPTSVTEASGTSLARTTTITWHATYPKPTQIVAPNLTVDMTYDADGNLLTLTLEDTTTHTVPYITDGDTRVWTYTYTLDGQLKTVDGPLSGTGDTTTFDYDTAGFLTKVTDALGFITDITAVNGRGQPTSITDPNSVVVDFAYNHRGWLTKRTVDPGANEAVTRFEYDGIGQITRIIPPDGIGLNFTYDNARRLTEVSNDSGEKIIYTLNDLGNVTKEEIKTSGGTLKKSLTRTFDELGRTLTHVGAGTQTTTYGYDKNDLLTSIEDDRGNDTSFAFDALNRLITTTDALLNDADYDYNASDDLTDVTDQRALVTTYVHNGFGDVIRRDSPDTGITDYEYDAAGNVTKITDARNVVTNFTYDNLYRVKTKTFPASTGENVTYTYDDVTGGNKGKGRLTKIEGEAGSISYVYDARGNVTKETRVIDTKTYVTEYAYDIADRLTQITYPSGRIVDYLRDGEGRVSAVTTKKTSTAATVVVASNIAYRPFGPVESVRYGNGLVATYAYDNDYRLTAIDTAYSTTAVQDLDYAYGDVNGDAGEIRSIDDNLDATLDQTFDYDVLYRLTDADGVYGDIDYAYDAVGNRTSRTIVDGGTTTETLTYATTSNRLSTVSDGTTTRTLTYTANGNVTTDSRGNSFDYLYNDANRIETVKENSLTVATYTYNNLGQRVIKDLGSSDITHYHFDLAGILIAETDEAAVLDREYIHLDGLPLAVIDSATAGTPTEDTIDNDDTEASSTGTWTSATGGTGYEGTDYDRKAGGTGTDTFTWTPTITTGNQYQVYAKWPANPSRASSATYTVHHADGSTAVTVDQRADGGQWTLLGNFVMSPSANHRVVLSDQADDVTLHDVVIDNSDAGVTETGTWVSKNWLGGGVFWGADFQRMDVAETTAKFTWPASAVPEAGPYRVYARWPATYGTTTYANAADFKIFHDGGTATVTVNQRESGGQWNELGVYDLTPGAGPIVELSGFDNNGWLAADAIRIVRLKSSDGEEVIDDTEDPGVTFVGSWTSSSSTAGGFPIGSVFRYGGRSSGGSGAKQVHVPITVTSADTYRVYVRWMQATARATNAPFTVHHDGGTTLTTFNQKINGGIWMLLGTYDLTPASSPKVVLTDNANGRVAFDAVRTVRHTTTDTETIVDNGDTGTAEVGTWSDGTWTGGGIYYGTEVRYVNDLGDGTNTYTWPLDVDGRYAVYARWTASTNRNATADYTVHHAGGTTTITYDQQIEGAVWKPLGVYDLESAETHKVVLADTGLGVTIADAVLLVPMEIESRVVSADAVKLVANDAEDVLTIHADHLGAPQKMTDDTRTVVWDAAFTPFGEEDSIIGAETNNWRFPGQYADDESGLSYNWHRTYDPAIGRYLQSDPIGLAGGLNTYAYVGGNPVSFTDPTGLQYDASPMYDLGRALGELLFGGGRDADDYDVCERERDFLEDLDPDDGDDDPCEERYQVETETCEAVGRARGAQAAAACHASAAVRYSECLRWGVGGVRTPLNIWNH